MSRALDLLSSTRNLFGMGFALAGLAGVLVGVIGPGWPAIVVGLYVLGVLLDLARPHRSQPAPVAPPPVAPSVEAAPVPVRPELPTTDPELSIEGVTDLAVIGRGGFSTVYVGRDAGFNRLVAVKVLHELDDNGRRWFDRERAIMGQLSGHPHIITPFRLGHTGSGAPYMVMEYVPGGSLDDRLARQGPLPWAEVVGYALQMCDALDHAHQGGILHRDVKPANILLAKRGAKLTDFGIASIRSATATATEVALTLAHCPPEAFVSGTDERDERSDVYSLASTLHTLLTGRPPFDLAPDPDGFRSPDTTPAYLQRIIGHPVPHLGPEVAPTLLDDLLQVAMAKDPTNRPGSASDFGAALAGIAAPGARR